VNQQERKWANTKVKHKYITWFSMVYLFLDPSNSSACFDTQILSTFWPFWILESSSLKSDVRTVSWYINSTRPSLFYLHFTNRSWRHEKVYPQKSAFTSRRSISKYCVSSLYVFPSLYGTIF
jgi:hypothetical protein